VIFIYATLSGYNDIFSPYYPTHIESNRTVQLSKRAITFTSPQIFQLYFSYLIFFKSSVIFSYDYFMLPAWARRIVWNSFPLCRSTVFKLTFEELISKSHTVGVACWCPTTSITEQTTLQNTRLFSSQKNSLNSFWRLRSKHTHFRIPVEKISPSESGT